MIHSHQVNGIQAVQEKDRCCVWKLKTRDYPSYSDKNYCTIVDLIYKHIVAICFHLLFKLGLCMIRN